MSAGEFAQVDSVILIACVLAALVSIVVAILFCAAIRRMPRLASSGEVPGSPKRVSVIIPARNEEKDLADALNSVLVQKGIALEILLVNDHSTDRTGQIADAMAAKDPRMKVLHNVSLGDGWLGKANAMQHGAAEATGDFLLFTDADIIHASHCFATALAALERGRHDFISLEPRHYFCGVGENTIAPLCLWSAVHFWRPKIHDPKSPHAMGSGALMLVKKSAFQAVGGFEPVKSAMLDDVMFAQLLKRKGHSVAYALAPDLLRVRLFKNSRDAFWGPTKNILSPFQGRMWLAVWFALPITLLPFFIYGTPLLALGFATGNYLLLITGAMTYALQYVTLFLGREQSRFDPLKTLCFPLISIVTTCCIVRALYYHFAKGAVMWRGRAIVVEGRI